MENKTSQEVNFELFFKMVQKAKGGLVDCLQKDDTTKTLNECELNHISEIAAEYYQSAVRKAIDKSKVFSPFMSDSDTEDLFKSPPKYGGKKEDGNPIAFYVRHWTKYIEAKKIYQFNLKQYDPNLVQALWNIFKRRNWQNFLIEAHEIIENEGLSPIVYGTPIKKAESVADILPPRSNDVLQKFKLESMRKEIEVGSKQDN